MTIPVLADAAARGGFVDHLKFGDGNLRAVPLLAEHDARWYPQFGLALACAQLGVDPADVRAEPDRVFIPAFGSRGEIAIPVRTIWSQTYGNVGAFLDVPWFGTRDWQTMYDVPRHREVRCHLPVTKIWGLAAARAATARNRAEVKSALAFFGDWGGGFEEAARASTAGAGVAADAVGALPDGGMSELAALNGVIEETLTSADSLGGISAFDGMRPEELTEEDRTLIHHYKALKDALAQSRRFADEAAEMRRELEGKAVLVGWTASGVVDEWATSIHARCPGVVVHGAVFNAIMSGGFWRRAPAWVTPAITALLGLLTTAAVALMSPWKALAASLLLLGGYLAFNGLVLFDYGDWIVGAAGPVVAIGVTWSGLTLTRFIVESAERRRITRRFRSYVDPKLVNYVIEHPELARLEGEVRELTVVFTDLAGFTTLTEKLREKAVPILSDYMSRMVPVIRRHNGLVNKFLGDGIMFFFGAPQPSDTHAADAVAAVTDMQPVLDEFNRELAGLSAAAGVNLSMRAGITTGPMVVGDAGGAEGSDYTVLGDAVNLAARLESANKAVGTRIMISARTAELLGPAWLVRPVANLRVAGKTEGVMTYEPLARADAATEEQRRLAAASRRVFECFRAGSIDDCLAAVDELEREFGPGKWTALYRDRCQRCRAEPPTAPFDGVIALSEK